VLYTADGKTLVCFPAGNTRSLDEIEATTIVTGALSGYQGMTKTYTLKYVEGAKGTTEVSSMAWVADSGIETIIIEEGYTSIAASAFKDLTSLKSITLPSTMETIGDSAFEGCTSLTSVTIPASVTSIGKAAFANCTALGAVVFSAAAEGTEEVALAAADGKDHATGKYGAFENCTALTSVTLPSRLTEIPAYMFYGSGLTEIELPLSITAIGNYAFESCAALKSVILNEGLTSVGVSAFDTCAALTNVQTRNADGTLTGAEGDITLPTTVEEINSYMFNDCVSLNPKIITLYGTNTVRIFEGCTGLTNITLKGDITQIPSGGFKGCTSLKSVVLPEGLETIGTEAFMNCTSLESLTIPSTVTTIGIEAFENCTSIKELVIPATVINVSSSTVPYDVAKLSEYGLFGGWTSEQKVILEYRNRELLNWSAYWSIGTNATIVYRLVED